MQVVFLYRRRPKLDFLELGNGSTKIKSLVNEPWSQNAAANAISLIENE